MPRANYGCPDCDGELVERVRRLMYSCKRCGEVIVEIEDRGRVVA